MNQNSSDPLLNEIVRQHSSLIQTENGFTFRDLNKNGKLDIYEDPRQPIEARVDDLLSQMTLAEKAGMMFINGAAVNADGSGLARLTTNGWQWDRHPSWSPDGTRIAFYSVRISGYRQIWVMNADGSGETNISQNQYNDWDPIWLK